MLKISGLWKNVDKNGKEYLSGSVGRLKVFVFANNNKTAENQPDFELLIDETRRQPVSDEDDISLD